MYTMLYHVRWLAIKLVNIYLISSMFQSTSNYVWFRLMDSITNQYINCMVQNEVNKHVYGLHEIYKINYKLMLKV